MTSLDTLQELTMAFRRTIAGMIEGESARADVRPPTWNNTLHWHAGHLVTTPRVLTFGMMGEPLGIPSEYRKWFAKGSSPDVWGEEPVPSFEELVPAIVELTPSIFDAWRGRENEPFPQPFQTSVGVLLRTPLDALRFSLVHDGTHMGMILALKRGLNGMEA